MSKYAVLPLNDYVETCDHIRGLTGTENKIKSGDLANKVGDVFSAGISEGIGHGFEEGHEIGYQEGYADGEWNGQSIGYDIGKEDGRAEGFNEGKSAGYNEGHQSGYQEGYADGQQEGYETGETAGYENGEKAGKRDAYDKFWNEFQLNGERRWYWGAFAGPGWSDETFKPKYPIIADGTCGYCFRNSKITHIPRFELLTTNVTQIFYDAKELKTIDCFALPNGGSKFTTVFHNCPALENLTIEGEICGNGFDVSQSTKLTHDSLMSIINALKDFYPTVVDDYVFRGTDVITHLAMNSLVSGATYKLTYDYCASPDVGEYETIFNNTEAVASKIDVYGVGESVGVHYVTDYLFYPDQYTFNVVIFDNGIGELFAIRYLQDKVTGDKQYAGNELDRMILTAELDNSTHTVTLGAANLNKLTDDEKQIATMKGWVLNE